MITSRFINFFLLFILIDLLFIIIINFNLKEKKILSFLGCLVSLMIIVSICFFPFPTQGNLVEHMKATGQSLDNNFIPFKTIYIIIKEAFQYHLYGNIVYQIFGNILLFAPLGFSISFFLQNRKKTIKVISCIVFISFSIETLQGILNYLLELNYRSVDIDDLILNTIGGILGYVFSIYILGFITNKAKKIY